MKIEPVRLVSIAIPHYETPVLVRLCLRAIRRFSQGSYEVLVIDNGSTDSESLAYLRGLKWIRLFEVPAVFQAPGEAHAASLNIALREAKGEFLLAMHTDSIVRSPVWLQHLLQPFADPTVAVAGPEKHDPGSSVRRLIRQLSDKKVYSRSFYRLLRREYPSAWQPRVRHPRSYCAVYHRSILLREGLDFLSREPGPVGQQMYVDLMARGYRARIFPPGDIERLVLHIGHATSYLASGRRINTARVRRRTGRRLSEVMALPWARELMENDSLDG